VVIWLPLLGESGGDASIVEVSGCFSNLLSIGGDGYERGKDVAGSGGDSDVEGDGE